MSEDPADKFDVGGLLPQFIGVAVVVLELLAFRFRVGGSRRGYNRMAMWRYGVTCGYAGLGYCRFLA